MQELSNTQLVVKTNKLQLIMLVLLGVILIPMAAAIIINSMRRGGMLALLIAAVILIIYGVIMFLFVRAYRMSVRSFEPSGLTRNDGKAFPWTDLSRIVEKVQVNRTSGLKGTWRIEMEFKGGTAWLLPTKIGNFPTVMDVLSRLPCERTEVRV